MTLFPAIKARLSLAGIQMSFKEFHILFSRLKRLEKKSLTRELNRSLLNFVFCPHWRQCLSSEEKG
jgi:hypothetical protein